MKYAHRFAALGVIFICGCSFFSRKENHFYALRAVPASAAMEIGTDESMAVDSVELPPGLDRREVVVRGSDLQLDVRGTDLWADSLETMVLHTLAYDLAQRLPEGSVVLPGQTRPKSVSTTVDVAFEEFAAGPEPVFRLRTHWTAKGTSHLEDIEVPMSSLDSGEVARAASSALGLLADRIAGFASGTPRS